MKMIYLGVVSSPFQLMCLNEYLKTYNINTYSILSYYDSLQEKSQMEAVISLLILKNVKLKKAIRGLQYLDPYKYSIYKACDILIIGNYFTRLHRLFQKRITHNKVILVDDGSISLNLINKLNLEKVTNPYDNSNQLDKVLGIDNHFRFDLFTIFKISSNDKFNVIGNNLEYLNSIVGKAYPQKHTIIIIGQPLVEKNFIDKKNYMMYLKEVKRKFDGFRQYYFPSRKESQENINNIKKEFGFIVKIPEINIELYLIKNRFFPEHIIGISTSALFSLSKILEKLGLDTRISYFKLSNFINVSYSEFSKKIYSEYEEIGIKKLSFESTD